MNVKSWMRIFPLGKFIVLNLMTLLAQMAKKSVAMASYSHPEGRPKVYLILSTKL